MLFGPGSASAQLRPLDPAELRAFDDARFRLQTGGSVYWEQYASLAGVRGRLVEAGEIKASFRSGRFIMEVAGTIQRLFREDSIIREPAEGVVASGLDRTRQDAGDYRVQTLLLLTSDTAPVTAVLRFGTRLPTTDNRVGLERDQTDFFATVAAGRDFGALHAQAEAGVGINGTRLSDFEQLDVFVYAALLEYRGSRIAPFLSLVGQNDFHRRIVRGNEDLGEIRAGLRFGQRQWLNAAVVHGITESSPKFGVSFSAGASFGR